MSRPGDNPASIASVPESQFVNPTDKDLPSGPNSSGVDRSGDSGKPESSDIENDVSVKGNIYSAWPQSLHVIAYFDSKKQDAEAFSTTAEVTATNSLGSQFSPSSFAAAYFQSSRPRDAAAAANPQGAGSAAGASLLSKDTDHAHDSSSEGRKAELADGEARGASGYVKGAEGTSCLSTTPSETSPSGKLPDAHDRGVFGGSVDVGKVPVDVGNDAVSGLRQLVNATGPDGPKLNLAGSSLAPKQHTPDAVSDTAQVREALAFLQPPGHPRETSPSVVEKALTPPDGAMPVTEVSLRIPPRPEPTVSSVPEAPIGAVVLRSDTQVSPDMQRSLETSAKPEAQQDSMPPDTPAVITLALEEPHVLIVPSELPHSDAEKVARAMEAQGGPDAPLLARPPSEVINDALKPTNAFIDQIARDWVTSQVMEHGGLEALAHADPLKPQFPLAPPLALDSPAVRATNEQIAARAAEYLDALRHSIGAATVPEALRQALAAGPRPISATDEERAHEQYVLSQKRMVSADAPMPLDPKNPDDRIIIEYNRRVAEEEHDRAVHQLVEQIFNLLLTLGSAVQARNTVRFDVPTIEFLSRIERPSEVRETPILREEAPARPAEPENLPMAPGKRSGDDSTDLLAATALVRRREAGSGGGKTDRVGDRAQSSGGGLDGRSADTTEKPGSSAGVNRTNGSTAESTEAHPSLVSTDTVRTCDPGPLMSVNDPGSGERERGDAPTGRDRPPAVEPVVCYPVSALGRSEPAESMTPSTSFPPSEIAAGVELRGYGGGRATPTTNSADSGGASGKALSTVLPTSAQGDTVRSGPASTFTADTLPAARAAADQALRDQVLPGGKVKSQGTVGAALEAADKATLDAASLPMRNVNDFRPNSRNVTAIDLFGAGGARSDKAIATQRAELPARDKSRIAQFLKDLMGLPTNSNEAVARVARVSEEIAANKADMIAKGQWPKELPTTATAKDIVKYINDNGAISIPSNHVESVRAWLRGRINNNPYEFGLPEHPTAEQVKALTDRIVSGGITGHEIDEINRRVLGLK